MAFAFDTSHSDRSLSQDVAPDMALTFDTSYFDRSLLKDAASEHGAHV